MIRRPAGRWLVYNICLHEDGAVSLESLAASIAAITRPSPAPARRFAARVQKPGTSNL